MFLLKTFLLAVLVAAVHSRTIQEVYYPYELLEDGTSINEEEFPMDEFKPAYPINLRAKRQLHGSVNTNPDGTANIFGKLPLTGNGNNMLSATGSLNSVKPGGSFGASSAGLAFDNVNGHGLSLTGSHIPSFGNQLTAAGKMNLLNTDRHNVNANAFFTRNLPTIPNAPNFNTVGSGLDYTFNNKIGASLGVAHTPLFQKTDVSAMGNLNLFRNRGSSLDFNAGASRSFSPFIPKSSWQPNFGMSFSRHF